HGRPQDQRCPYDPARRVRLWRGLLW
ncbi:hypothetical protein BN1708_020545, partial [Verticillium longisporum]